MNKNEAKNRGWVKNAAIIFFAALAVLTFFSNTILNRSLPEVQGVNAYGGEISTAVRVNGTVKATDAYAITIPGTTPRQIASILVKSGEDIEAGQVLLVLEPIDSDNSQAVRDAQNRVTTARDAYNKALISFPAADFDTQVNIDKLVAALDDAKAAVGNVLTAKAKIDAAQAAYDRAEAAQVTAKENYDKASADAANMPSAPAQVTSDTPGITAEQRAALWEKELDLQQRELYFAQVQLDQANGNAVIPEDAYTLADAAVKQVKLYLLEYQTEVFNTLKASSRELTDRVASLKKTLDAATKTTTDAKTALDKATADAPKDAAGKPLETVEAAEKAVKDAEIALEKASIGSVQANAEREFTLKSLRQAIDDAQFALDGILGTGGDQTNEVKSRYAGRILTIDTYVGQEVNPGTPISSIEINGKGYTLSASVTNAEAQRVHIGDIGQISSWGMNSVVCTLSAIKTDTQKPSTNKVLEFDVTGDNVMGGQNLEFTVGTRSQYYDMIVPNNAVRPMSSGSGNFILVATAKSTPLGTRYIATQVEIEVVNSDSTNTAIRGDLGWNPFVITSSSKPVEPNSQVRLAGG